MTERLTRSDWILLAICALVFATALSVGIALFDRAFPEASINFKYDRNTSRAIAERHLARFGPRPDGYRYAVVFRHDDNAKIYLERTLGITAANRVIESQVKVWYWRHRWFKPLEKEEFVADIAPSGELVALAHVLPEEAPARTTIAGDPRQVAEEFLTRSGLAVSGLRFLSSSEKKLPKRSEQILTWESQSIRPAGTPYRYTVVVRGASVAEFRQQLKVPDDWQRSYSELRSKNIAAGFVDQLFMLLTILAILVVFIVRLRRNDLQVRFAVGAGIVAAVLMTATSLNSYSNHLAEFDTNQSYAAFLTSFITFSVLEGVISGLFLMVVVGAGEALYRQRFPQHLAMPRLFRRSALGSKRVFFGFVIGYTLFAAFLAYQVLFYITASHYGAWSPADIPYDDIVNTTFPWFAVLLMGFFPAVSEEFMSRAFSIPFFESLFRSRVGAIVLAGFIWGFGHATYPNQPFYIRGLEVGIAGVVIGFLMIRFGLLPLLVWHYTVDALYTSLLLFRSGNTYYVASAALASLVFIVPLVASVVLYVRRGGFIADDDLENQTIGSVEPPSVESLPEPIAPLPPAPPRKPLVVTLLGISVAVIVTVLVLTDTPSHTDVVDYAVHEDEAIAIARAHLRQFGYTKLPERVIVSPVGGFRTWDEHGGREQGGGSRGFDEVAAEYVLGNTRTRPVETLLDIERSKVEAATWMVRFFAPQQVEEFLVEVDPRTRRALGFHRYLQESLRGASLDRAGAEAIARATAARYGFSAAAFDVKEALSFDQPARRDWLIHFEERQPLAADAFRRLHVRIAGDQVTQFTKTIRIPEAAMRKANERTVVSTAITLANFGGALLLGGLVIGGALSAARANRFQWRSATRLTLLVAAVPLLVMLTRWRSVVASYSTTTAWATFTTMAAVSLVGTFLMTLLAFWLSIALIRTAFPEAPAYFSRAGRSRFGRDAVLRALAAVSLVVVAAAVNDVIEHRLPHLFPLAPLDPSSVANDTLPALGTLWTSFSVALGITAAIACLGAAWRATPVEQRSRLAWLIAIALFLISIDASAVGAQLAVSLAGSVVAVAIILFVAFRLVAGNPVAYAVAAGAFLAVRGGADLWESNRLDLRVNAIVFTMLVIGGLAWLAWPEREREVLPE